MPSPIAPSVKQRQDLFLDAIREVGTMRKAAAVAHVGRGTVNEWRSSNSNGFRERLDEALDDFADLMEGKMFDLISEMKVGHNPTLLIFALKAARPLKYRELSQVPDDNARELLKKLELLVDRRKAIIEEQDNVKITMPEQIQKALNAGPSAVSVGSRAPNAS